MGQVKFAAEIGVTGAQVSRYEAGLVMPELRVLLNLFCRTAVPAERRVILRELHKRGLNDVMSWLRQSGLLGDMSTTHIVCAGDASLAMVSREISNL
jgi:hypothetical protein